MKSTHILILLFFNFTSIIMPAQVMSIGLSTGTTFYQGDVSERSLIHLKDYNLAFGGFIKFQLNNRISIRANFLKGRISGRDKIYTQIPWRMKRGFQFQSPITEVASMVEFDIIKKSLGHNSSISFYVLGGLGYVKANPQVDFNEPNAIYEQVEIDKFAKYSDSHLSAAMGIGIKWHINPYQTLSIEGADRTAFTDYLDGISNSAQPKFGDWYFISVLSFSQSFSFSNNKNGSHKQIPNKAVFCPRF